MEKINGHHFLAEQMQAARERMEIVIRELQEEYPDGIWLAYRTEEGKADEYRTASDKEELKSFLGNSNEQDMTFVKWIGP